MKPATQKTHISFELKAKPFKHQHIMFCPPPSLVDHPDDYPWIMRPLIRLANKIVESREK